MGRPDEAVAMYEKALQVDAKNPLVHNNLGHEMQAKGRLDEALRCYPGGPSN